MTPEFSVRDVANLVRTRQLGAIARFRDFRMAGQGLSVQAEKWAESGRLSSPQQILLVLCVLRVLGVSDIRYKKRRGRLLPAGLRSCFVPLTQSGVARGHKLCPQATPRTATPGAASGESGAG